MKRVREKDSIAQQLIKAQDKSTLLRSLISTSDTELLTMPPETIVNHIVGKNVYVFLKLMRTSTLLRETLENIEELYFYLFKYIFRNETCILYNLLKEANENEYAIMNPELLRQKAYSYSNVSSIVTFLCVDPKIKDYFNEKGEFSLSNLIPLNGIPDALQNRWAQIYKLRSYDRDEIRYFQIGNERIMWNDESVFNACHHDDEIAIKTCSLFAVAHPFGFPHASFYMVAHAKVRAVALLITSFFMRIEDEVLAKFGIYLFLTDAAAKRDRNLSLLEGLCRQILGGGGGGSKGMVGYTGEEVSSDEYGDFRYTLLQMVKKVPLGEFEKIDVDYILDYWQKKMVPELKKYIKEQMENNQALLSEVDNFSAFLVTESPKFVITEEDWRTRYFDTISDAELHKRVSSVVTSGINVDPLAVKKKTSGVTSIYQTQIESLKKDPRNIYRILFYRMLAKEASHMRSGYYFDMKGCAVEMTDNFNSGEIITAENEGKMIHYLCSQCLSKEAFEEDDLFSLPFCSEECKNEAFSPYAGYLYV